MTTFAVDPNKLTLASLEPINQPAAANSSKTILEELLEASSTATRSFLAQCQKLFEIKQLGTEQWKEAALILEWTSHTANAYLKIGKWIDNLKINTYNLELLDINTIKTLCCDKYLDIWYWLQSQRLAVTEVRISIRDINKQLRKAKEPPKVLQWENNNGEPRLTIRLEDEDAGLEFEREFKKSGKVCVSFFLRELLRRPTLDEQLIPQQQEDYIEEKSEELPEEIKAAIATEELIHQLNAEYSSLSREIKKFENRLDATETMMYNQAFERREEVKRQLRLYGITPLEIKNK